MIRFSLILSFFIASFSVATHSHADCCGGQRDDVAHTQTAQRDYDSIKEYVNSKRSIPLEEKLNCLTLSGDIRTTWAHLKEKLNGMQIRGLCPLVEESGCSCPANSDDLVRLPSDAYEMEFNFYVDYVHKDAWAVSWLQFNNVAGLQGSKACCCTDKESCRGSGTCEGICLRKAYIGYNFCSNGTLRIDVEVGRRPMWTVFDSYIEFNSRFDGILGFASYNVCGFMDAYVKGGPFMIDEKSHHIGYVVEAGLLDAWDSRFDLKYSVVDWRKKGPNRCDVRNARGTQFLVHQFLGAYNLRSDYLWNKTRLYIAGLINTAARKREQTLFRRENLGFYAGFLMGEVCKAGDWSLDVCYQYVEPQAIPECDVSGIGIGNGLCESFTQGTTAANSGGRSNFRGWRFEGLYGLTSNFAIDVLVELSKAADPDVGGKHSYSKFQLEAIYAF